MADDWRNYPCKLWGKSTTKAGYGQWKKGGKWFLAHRMAWEEQVGPIPLGKLVMHRCDVRNCHEIKHLRLGTHADNSADMVSKGRQRRGEGLPQHKLTEIQVREIRSRGLVGESAAKIAQEFGIKIQTVGKIVRRERWAHLHEEST
jgi:hypothetical protein